MPKSDVVLSAPLFEAVKALLRSHSAVLRATQGDPVYLVQLPESCRTLVFSVTGGAVPSVSNGGVVVEEGVLISDVLARLEKL